jgi:ATP-dependent protease HslVU (ClpYQ) peptidase subunit
VTCIVGVEHEGEVFIGGDSAGVAGWALSLRADEKVFRNGPFIMGFTTSFRMGQLLRYSLGVVEQTDEQDDYEFMCTTFVNAVRACLKDGGLAKIENGVEEGGCFLVGYRGALYSVEDSFQVGRTQRGYHAIGCGDDVAIGALAALRDIDPEKRVILTLEIAEAHNAGVRGPFVVMS